MRYIRYKDRPIPTYTQDQKEKWKEKEKRYNAWQAKWGGAQTIDVEMVDATKTKKANNARSDKVKVEAAAEAMAHLDDPLTMGFR